MRVAAALEQIRQRGAAAAARPLAAAESYASVRPEFTDADLLCFRGHGVFGYLVRFFTNSRYSHVGLVYRFEGRVYCLEAVGSGVRLIIMSELLRRSERGIDYFRIRDVTLEQRAGALGFAFQQLGKLYDRAGIVRFLWFLLLGNKARARLNGRWFCSEIVQEAYRRQGVQLARQKASYTSPQDLVSSPRVEFLFRVKA